MKRRIAPEPDYRTACNWWSDLPNIWTPIGWKDHMFRFNVFWNGSILADPKRNPNTKKFLGQGVQITPNATFFTYDDGMYRQGWEDTDAPVLWTELPIDGLILRWSVFAHLPGGGDVQTGVDPLFAWARFKIHDICPGLPLEDRFRWNLAIQTVHASAGMDIRRNIQLFGPDQPYHAPLKIDQSDPDTSKPLHITEEDGRVRLGIAPGKPYPASLHLPEEKDPQYRLGVDMPTKKGAYFDLLIPMLLTDRDSFDRELAVGYDQALRQANRFWKPKPKTAAVFQVPEIPVNETIRHSLKFFEVLTEKNDETGKHCMVNGSFIYVLLWATPAAMAVVMMMDLMGYHDTAEKYLDIFRDEQGTVKPPGQAFEKHAGYLSTPARYKSIDWLTDNGAVLYMLAMHGLYSGNREYIERFTDTIVKSCQWIKDARRQTNHDGVKGILPPAVATDRLTEIQAIWSDGWNYKGLTAAVKLLKQIDHPRADEFEKEADQYRAAFVKAYRAKCRTMPKWTDSRGKRRFLPPTSFSGDSREESRHAFYLDGGPLFLVFAGLLDADDQAMETARLWFREGPPTKVYRYDSNCWQVPSLWREMSSCEPTYSWNILHSWQLADRDRFLEGLYSLLAGSVSRQTFISCETRGGITGNIFSAPMATYLARLAVIDDEIEPHAIHLLRLTPAAWLTPGEKCAFEKLATIYGPVTLKTHRSKDGKTLDVSYKPTYRTPPRKVVLHVPPVEGLKKIVLNGKTQKPVSGKIRLPAEP